LSTARGGVRPALADRADRKAGVPKAAASKALRHSGIRMESTEYPKLAAFEQWYWWYRAERTALVEAVRGLGLKPGARLLDAGCGSGRNLLELQQSLGITAYGVDLSSHAAALWNGEPELRRCLGSITALPYVANSFDAAVSVDVIGCAEVDPRRALEEMARVVRPGGGLVVLAPAFQFLLSTHDAAVHSVKRFRRTELAALAESAGLTVQRCSYLFALFFPMVAAIRLARKARATPNGRPPQSDLSHIPSWLNRTLLALARVDRRATNVLGAPFGSTVLMTARKGTA